MSKKEFVKSYRNCYQYEGDIFNMELIIDGDDVYKPGTILLGCNKMKNVLSSTFINNEIDLIQWDNDKFNDFLVMMGSGLSCTFDARVHDDRNTFALIILSYNHLHNILIIPLHEGKYYIDDIKIIVDQNVVNELYDLYNGIKKYYNCDSILIKK